MNQSKISVSKIESFSTVDGPGIRTTIFLNGCNLRCKFCHNPETWYKSNNNYTTEELFNKIIRNKPYFNKNGGVTFSGGEPLLQSNNLIELTKKLKKENIHISLDTAGIGNYNENFLKLVDLIILDIKHITKEGYKEITQTDNYENFIEFTKKINSMNKKIWIRQVIVPNVNDNKEYIKDLASFLKNNIKNIEKVEFLPFHTLGFEKYKDLKIKNPYITKKAMDEKECNNLYKLFIEEYKKEL